MSKRGLLHFGLDHLTINLGKRYDMIPIDESYIAQLFDFIESIGLNDSNTNEALNQKWEGWDETVDFYCEVSKQKNLTYSVHWNRHKIIRLEKIGIHSQLKQIGYKYDYRITFYGTIFALDRIKLLSFDDFVKPFITDSKDATVINSVSRFDVCADLFDITPMSVRKGFTTKGKSKKFSYLSQDPNDGSYETFYYGKKSNGWMLRCYDKKLDTTKKGRETLYPDYMKHQKVTRVEVEAKSQITSDYEITLKNVFDLNFIFSVFKKLLISRGGEFKIVNFIERELSKQGFKAITPERRKIDYEILSQTKMHKRFINLAVKLHQEYEVSFISLGEEIKLLESHDPEWLDLVYLGFGE